MLYTSPSTTTMTILNDPLFNLIILKELAVAIIQKRFFFMFLSNIRSTSSISLFTCAWFVSHRLQNLHCLVSYTPRMPILFLSIFDLTKLEQCLKWFYLCYKQLLDDQQAIPVIYTHVSLLSKDQFKKRWSSLCHGLISNLCMDWSCEG